MNPVISAQLREFAKANDLGGETQENQFEIYSIYAVLSGLLGESIDAYDVHLVGNEFGVDGLAVIIQGEIVKDRQEAEEKLGFIKNPSVEFLFFQSKASTSYDYGDISKFFDAISNFFDGSLNEESQAIADCYGAVQAIYEKGTGRRNPRISCYYIATGNYEEPARIEKLRQNFRAELEEKNIFDPHSIEVQIVGARELQAWYRAATSSVEVEIDFPRNVVMPDNAHVEEAYIGYVDARNLVKLFTTFDDNGQPASINRSVFFDNIRDYDDKSKINQSIRDGVLRDGGAEFVFRNNGITVVSRNIDRTGDKFRLEDFQIVNGCQTSNIIYDLLYGDHEDDRDVAALMGSIQVPLRLIGSKDDDFVSSIIVGTNRQNAVRDEQFWALRPFMKSLEEYSRNLEPEEVIFLERRDNQYRNQEVERTRVTQPSVLMKAVAACLLFQPQRAARDYRGILAEYEDKIFLDEHDVRIYHAVAYLYYRMEFLWRNQRLKSDYKTFRYYIMAAIGLWSTEGKPIFSQKKNRIAKISDDIIALAKSEEKLKQSIMLAVGIIENRLGEMGVSNQEKVRDTIRSESFSTTFRERVMAAI